MLDRSEVANGLSRFWFSAAQLGASRCCWYWTDLPWCSCSRCWWCSGTRATTFVHCYIGALLIADRLALLTDYCMFLSLVLANAMVIWRPLIIAKSFHHQLRFCRKVTIQVLLYHRSALEFLARCHFCRCRKIWNNVKGVGAKLHLVNSKFLVQSYQQADKKTLQKSPNYIHAPWNIHQQYLQGYKF